MVREGGFHPFKGRVSRHFGDSVCVFFLCLFERGWAFIWGRLWDFVRGYKERVRGFGWRCGALDIG